MTMEQAKRLALVGPVARAAGCPPTPAATTPRHRMTGCRPRRRTVRPGDALARMQVMAAEAAESVRLLASAGRRGRGLRRRRRAARTRVWPGLGGVLPRRGLTWVQLDAEGRVELARLRPASVRNWRAFDDAARAQNVFTDIPIIEASFWLTVAGGAR